MSASPQHLTWVELDRQALLHNLEEFRRKVGPDVLLLAVVKANAYGHGMEQVARLALEGEADWLGVNSVEEGVRLRQLGLACPILVLGYAGEWEHAEALAADLDLTVYDRQTVRRLAQLARRLKRPARLHLKVETGTNRQGLLPADLGALLEQARGLSGIEVRGLSTHFANIEDTTNHTYARSQLENFQAAAAQAAQAGFAVPLKHTACTAATILFPETYFEMVRVGIGLYGLWPSKETLVSSQQRGEDGVNLTPVLSWYTRVGQLKWVPRGAFVGYGCTYRTTRRTHLAVLPVGYFDGYDRRLSNTGHVLIRGRRAPIRGRVCMDMTMADVTDIPGVQVEEPVTLIGRDGEEQITADEMARWAGTINYEVVTRIGGHLPRLFRT